MPWSLGSKDWGSFSGRTITHIFFRLVQVVLVSLGALAGVFAQGEHNRFSGFGSQSGLVGYSVQWVGTMVEQPSSRTHQLVGCWGIRNGLF